MEGVIYLTKTPLLGLLSEPKSLRMIPFNLVNNVTMLPNGTLCLAAVIIDSDP